MEKELTYYQINDRAEKFFKNNSRIKGGVEMACALGDFLNGAGSEEIEQFLQTMTQHEHRTIQQSYFGLLLKSILKFAEIQNYDGRNQYSVETAKKLKEFMDANYIGGGCPLI